MKYKYAMLIILYLETVMNVHFQGTSMKGVIITTWNIKNLQNEPIIIGDKITDMMFVTVETQSDERNVWS